MAETEGDHCNWAISRDPKFLSPNHFCKQKARNSPTMSCKKTEQYKHNVGAQRAKIPIANEYEEMRKPLYDIAPGCNS